VPRHIARLVTRLVVDYSASRRLVLDYFASAACPGASDCRAARHAARRRLLRLRRASECLGTSHGSSRGSSSTTPPRAGSSSTTSPTPHVRVPRHVAWLVTRLVADYSASRRLVVDYFAYTARPVPRHVVRLVTPLVVDCSASHKLVVDYFAYAALPGGSARHAARHAARRAARRRLLRLRHASGCLGTSHGSSRHSSSTTLPRAGSSLTTLPSPRALVLRHVARLVTRLVAPLVVDYSASRRLVLDYFASAARPGASARRAATHAARRAAHRRLLHLVQARRQLLRLRRASGCLGTSRGSSRGSCAARRRLLRLTEARRQLLRLRRASGCLGTSRGSSRGSSRRSSWTTPPRAGSSLTTSPTSRVQVPRHVARLVSPLAVDYFAYAARPGASAHRAACHAARRAARR
jgi:hypothetical protein